MLGLHDRVKVVQGDLFKQDLTEAIVVVCYLLQRTNNRLEGKLRRELRPGARVASRWFTFPELRLVRRDDRDKLYIYTTESGG